MELLEGCVAFALAIAGLATICTTVIELLHRVFALRADGLRTMISAYAEVVVKDMGQAVSDMDKLKANLLASLTQKPLMEQLEQGAGWRIPKWLRNRLMEVDRVSKEEFLQRVPDSDLYKQLVSAGQKTGEEILEIEAALTRRFEEYSQVASYYFKNRARFLSLVVGVILAFAMNIHAGRIFDAFVKDPDLAQRMEAQAEAIRTTLAAQAANASVDPATWQSIQDEVGKTREALKSYQDIGLPIGWSYYPNCLGVGEKDTACTALKLTKPGPDACVMTSIWTTLSANLGSGLSWFLTVLLTGLLIGLGGPFWYDVAVKLSNLRSTLTGKPGLPPAATPLQG